MAIIDTAASRALAGTQAPSGPILDWVRKAVDQLRREQADEAWAWFDRHRETVIYTHRMKVLRVIPITVHLRVEHCEFILRTLVGNRPHQYPRAA